MSDDVVIGALIDRLLAKRPDLWSGFHLDPLGALEEAGIRVTDEERAALERAGHIEASALHVGCPASVKAAATRRNLIICKALPIVQWSKSQLHPRAPIPGMRHRRKLHRNISARRQGW